MTARHSSAFQLTLNLEPSVVERWDTLREYIAYRMQVQLKKQSVIASEMDLSPTVLSKKLHQNEGDGHRFTCDDLEAYLHSTGDIAAVLEYLATKFSPGGDAAVKARTMARLQSLATTIERELARLSEGAP